MIIYLKFCKDSFAKYDIKNKPHLVAFAVKIEAATATTAEAAATAAAAAAAVAAAAAAK